MATIPASILKTNAGADSPPRVADACVRRSVVLAGADALGVRADVENCAAMAGVARTIEIVPLETILEAVLTAGGVAAGLVGEARGEAPPLILVGVSQELDQLESAVRSLRKVYGPAATIVLLCDPSDEVLSRKAKGWGATDYLLLPLEPRELKPLFSAGAPAAKRANGNGHASAVSEKLPIRAQPMRNGRDFPSDLTLPAIPLLVQTKLLADLMTGQPDFVDRAVATLQSYVKWEGMAGAGGEGALRFAALADDDVMDTGRPGEMHAPVRAPGPPPFGALILTQKNAGESPPTAPPALSQAADWLGAMLSIARRAEQLRALAVTDELSGAYNRRYFNKFMAGLLERSRANRSRVTLLLFDIDDFKKYNDKFGHASGDAIIRELIKLLRSCTREHDVVARLGGDEFAVVYWDKGEPRQPNSEHPRDVLIATERFRKAIKAHEWSGTCNIQGEISISGGMATFPWDAETLEQLMAKADEALLRAKSAGKNVILLHGCDGVDSHGETVQAAVE